MCSNGSSTRKPMAQVTFGLNGPVRARLNNWSILRLTDDASVTIVPSISQVLVSQEIQYQGDWEQAWEARL
jgi:hypothetical protein